MMTAKIVMFVCAIGLLQGCDEPSRGPLSSPTAVPPVTQPCPLVSCQLIPFRVSGIATDDHGQPVAGATVAIRPFILGQSPPPIVTTTDAAGTYRVEFDGMRDAVGGAGGAVVELPGHETYYRYLGPGVPQDIVQNIHLYRIKHIRPGEPVSLIVRPDDTACGFDDEWVCRRVRVIAPHDGRLTVTLVSQNPQDRTGLEVYEGPPPGRFNSNRCCSSEVSLSVRAGVEVIVNVLVWWSTKTSHSFTLETSFANE
jgi:hypothetical protein